jgi:hypothetical protein
LKVFSCADAVMPMEMAAAAISARLNVMGVPLELNLEDQVGRDNLSTVACQFYVNRLANAAGTFP